MKLNLLQNKDDLVLNAMNFPSKSTIHELISRYIYNSLQWDDHMNNIGEVQSCRFLKGLKIFDNKWALQLWLWPLTSRIITICFQMNLKVRLKKISQNGMDTCRDPTFYVNFYLIWQLNFRMLKTLLYAIRRLVGQVWVVEFSESVFVRNRDVLGRLDVREMKFFVKKRILTFIWRTLHFSWGIFTFLEFLSTKNFIFLASRRLRTSQFLTKALSLNSTTQTWPTNLLIRP